MTEFPDIPGERIAYGTCRTGPLVLLAHGPGDLVRRASMGQVARLAGLLPEADPVIS